MNPSPINPAHMTAERLDLAARKAKQQWLQYEEKAKDAMRKGNIDLARIHGESAVRCKNEALNYLRLQAQMEGVQGKVATMQVQQQVTAQIGEVNQMLEQALPPGAMERAAGVLERYGEQVEGLDVQTGLMDRAFAEAGASSAPSSEVDDLVRKIAAENAIDVAGMLPEIPQARVGVHAPRQQHAASTVRRPDARHGPLQK